MNKNNIAYHPFYKTLLNNQVFNPEHLFNWNGVLNKWIALKKYLAEKNINLNTYDVYNNFKNIDIWIIQEPTLNQFKFLLRNRINPRRVIFIITEPPVINPWGWKYLKYYSWMFKAILTWSTELCSKNKKFYHYHFPQQFDTSKYAYYKTKQNKNLCLLMHSNKYSSIKGELYSLRREIISYFVNRGDFLLDLYGYDWDKISAYKSVYKGTTSDKIECYSEYCFSFCIDNSIVPGYITYDPLISMATGTVPIYIPMPDSTKYIPSNTFIDYTNFKNLDELVLYLKFIVNTNEYENYRENGWEYLNSCKFHPFTIKKFCEDVYHAIQAVN